MKPAAGFCGTSDRATGTPAFGHWAAWGAEALCHQQARVQVTYLGPARALADLRRELDQPADEPPGALLAAAWARWSHDFVHRLAGPCVLALQDGEDLLLYRDPSGLRNLYWHQGQDGRIDFATHLGALPRRPGTARRVSWRSLHEYLHFLDITAPHTIFDGVYAVESGALLRQSARGMVPVATQLQAAPLDPEASFEQAVGLVQRSLERSIDVSLDPASSPAAFLSGGVDSSLICALARRRHPETVAVTVGFDDHAFDEGPVAARIADHLGLRHEMLRFGQDELESAFDRLMTSLEQPMADPSTPATVLAFEHCRERFDVVLDGTGADEPLGAMPPRHLRLAVQYASLVPFQLRSAAARGLRAWPTLAAYARWLDFEHPADLLRRWHGFSRREIAWLCGGEVSFDHTTFFRTFARFPRHAHFERYSALVDTMSSDRLVQATLATSAPLHYPFCDRATERFLRQLRTEYRYLPGQPKRILRALLARYVPPSIWDGPKRGFTFPLHRFLAADDHRLVRRHLDPDRWRPRGWISAPGVGGIAQRFIAGDTTLTFRVWALVVLGAWLENHDELH